jgi:hypothetical protein
MVSLARRRSPDAQCRPSLVEATTLEPLTPALFEQSKQEHARPVRPAYCFSGLLMDDVDVRILSQRSICNRDHLAVSDTLHAHFSRFSSFKHLLLSFLLSRVRPTLATERLESETGLTCHGLGCQTYGAVHTPHSSCSIARPGHCEAQSSSTPTFDVDSFCEIPLAFQPYCSIVRGDLSLWGNVVYRSSKLHMT